MTDYLKYIVRFILLILLQIFILSKIDLFGFMNPFLYIIFIVTLPFKIKHTPLIIISFLMGYCIDLLSGNIMGIHSASAILVGFLRPAIINIVSSSESDYDTKHAPDYKNIGAKWFFTYAGLLVFIFNLSYYFLEHFTFSGFFKTLSFAIANTIFTLFVFFVYQFLGGNKRQR